MRVEEANNEGSAGEGETGRNEGALSDRRLEDPCHKHANK